MSHQKDQVTISGLEFSTLSPDLCFIEPIILSLIYLLTFTNSFNFNVYHFNYVFVISVNYNIFQLYLLISQFYDILTFVIAYIFYTFHMQLLSIMSNNFNTFNSFSLNLCFLLADSHTSWLIFLCLLIFICELILDFNLWETCGPILGWWGLRDTSDSLIPVMAQKRDLRLNFPSWCYLYKIVALGLCLSMASVDLTHLPSPLAAHYSNSLLLQPRLSSFEGLTPGHFHPIIQELLLCFLPYPVPVPWKF